MFIVIDNYDSFTYNLVQHLGELGCQLEVYRNDQISVATVQARRPQGVIISPGPGRPEDAGISVELIARLGPTMPILGVCLGHQAIGHVFGGEVVRAPNLMHGKTSLIEHQEEGVFRTLDHPFIATRYHSLIVSAATLPPVLQATAWLAGDPSIIMGLQHRQWRHIQGVQFHPESVLTVSGRQLLRNFVELAGAFHAQPPVALTAAF